MLSNAKHHPLCIYLTIIMGILAYALEGYSSNGARRAPTKSLRSQFGLNFAQSARLGSCKESRDFEGTVSKPDSPLEDIRIPIAKPRIPYSGTPVIYEPVVDSQGTPVINIGEFCIHTKDIEIEGESPLIAVLEFSGSATFCKDYSLHGFTKDAPDMNNPLDMYLPPDRRDPWIPVEGNFSVVYCQRNMAVVSVPPKGETPIFLAAIQDAISEGAESIQVELASIGSFSGYHIEGDTNFPRLDSTKAWRYNATQDFQIDDSPELETLVPCTTPDYEALGMNGELEEPELEDGRYVFIDDTDPSKAVACFKLVYHDPFALEVQLELGGAATYGSDYRVASAKSVEIREDESPSSTRVSVVITPEKPYIIFEAIQEPEIDLPEYIFIDRVSARIDVKPFVINEGRQRRESSYDFMRMGSLIRFSRILITGMGELPAQKLPDDEILGGFEDFFRELDENPICP